MRPDFVLELHSVLFLMLGSANVSQTQVDFMMQLSAHSIEMETLIIDYFFCSRQQQLFLTYLYTANNSYARKLYPRPLTTLFYR